MYTNTIKTSIQMEIYCVYFLKQVWIGQLALHSISMKITFP